MVMTKAAAVFPLLKNGSNKGKAFFRDPLRLLKFHRLNSPQDVLSPADS